MPPFHKLFFRDWTPGPHPSCLRSWSLWEEGQWGLGSEPGRKLGEKGQGSPSVCSSGPGWQLVLKVLRPRDMSTATTPLRGALSSRSQGHGQPVSACRHEPSAWCVSSSSPVLLKVTPALPSLGFCPGEGLVGLLPASCPQRLWPPCPLPPSPTGLWKPEAAW